ncbi:unnamed protein product [Aspergillus oryzae]|nr:unnamed protein product [Aspergillus oryzae]
MIQTVAIVLIAAERPRSCPVSMLFFFAVELAVETAVILNRDAYAVSRVYAHCIAASAAAAACATILFMPFRGPSLPRVEIGVVGQPPSSKFRSPEDNLRLWQFITVSWMSPLMTAGKHKQLNEDDVWFLGFEFQHRRLHEKFRQLRGSVISRLLQANGIDVLIITGISTVQMLCGPCITIP